MGNYKEKEILTKLNTMFQSKKIESNLEKCCFMDLYKEAVKDIYPKLKEKYANQSIYGISFEIANVVQSVYNEDYFTIIYLNTEEMYQKAIEDCEDEEEEVEYRFSTWGAEWEVINAETPFFYKVQKYLEKNSLGFYSSISIDMESRFEADMKEWYEKAEAHMEEVHEEERENIRIWLAEALGELRKEGFWEEQGNPHIYVLPFEGECDISKEEMIETFKEMDQGCHGLEYLDYIEEYCE